MQGARGPEVQCASCARGQEVRDRGDHKVRVPVGVGVCQGSSIGKSREYVSSLSSAGSNIHKPVQEIIIANYQSKGKMNETNSLTDYCTLPGYFDT